MNFKGKKVAITGGDQPAEFDCDLNVDRQPKWLDFIERDGTTIVSHNKGIYTLERDTLTICHGGPFRPAKFTIRTGQYHGDSLVVLKRKR